MVRGSGFNSLVANPQFFSTLVAAINTDMNAKAPLMLAKLQTIMYINFSCCTLVFLY